MTHDGSMRTYRYLHLDVFTDHPFEGNQLAVFLESAGLTAVEMQRIAKEMAFSESTFILPRESSDSDIRMRIFTPGEELPMAGHPTIGSTFALAAEGVIAPGREQFVFGLGVGPTPVSLSWKGDALDFVWMTQKPPVVTGRVHDVAAFSAALGLTPDDVHRDLPIEAISCGVPFLFAPLTTRSAVDRVAISRSAYHDALNQSGIPELPLFVFSLDPTGSVEDESVYSRMLAPGFGIGEDPATGGATGPLGCYLFMHGLLPSKTLQHFVSLQGVQMGRPSRLHVSIEGTGDEITRVRVGGRSVIIGEGRLSF
jgi:trans-2,3-dihydro-3-hydroxyanthranilate isomerase